MPGYASHGPRPANKTIDIQRKVYHLGIKSTIASKFFEDQLFVVDELKLEERSKELLRLRLETLGLAGKKGIVES